MRIQVKAKPLAKEEKIEQTGEHKFAVSVKEPTREGRANKAICSALAEYFKVPISCVQLVMGFSSKQKVFDILQKE